MGRTRAQNLSIAAHVSKAFVEFWMSWSTNPCTMHSERPKSQSWPEITVTVMGRSSEKPVIKSLTLSQIIMNPAGLWNADLRCLGEQKKTTRLKVLNKITINVIKQQSKDSATSNQGELPKLEDRVPFSVWVKLEKVEETFLSCTDE